MQKIAGTEGMSDAGAQSAQTISSGLGSVTFTPAIGGASGPNSWVGLGSTLSSPPDPSELTYAFSFWPDGGFEVMESGTYRMDSTFTAGDAFTIAIEAGPVVRYYKNSSAVWTSTSTPAAYPYALGASLIGINSQVLDASITGGGSGTGTNLLTDGDFEGYAPPSLGPPGWVSDTGREMSAKSDTSQPHAGAQNGACSGTTSQDCGIYQEVTAPLTGTYTLTGYVNADQTGALFGANVNGSLATSTGVDVRGFGTYGSPYTLTFSATEGDPIVVWMYSPASPGYAVIDDVSLTGATSSGSSVPTAYSAATDTNTATKPTLPSLGAAGYTFTDPAFASTIMRVTDANTVPNDANTSYMVASNAHLAVWNTTATRFFVEGSGDTLVPYSFDASTMTVSRIDPSPTGNGGLMLAFIGEPQFSLLDPDIIYGAAGANLRTIEKFNFSTETYTNILNLDDLVSGLDGTYVGSLLSAGTQPESLLVSFGGDSQEAHHYVYYFRLDNPSGGKLLDTLASTLDGSATSLTLGIHVHAISIDRTGRYVFLTTSATDYPNGKSPWYIWDTENDTFTALTSGSSGGGRAAQKVGHSPLRK